MLAQRRRTLNPARIMLFNLGHNEGEANLIDRTVNQSPGVVRRRARLPSQARRVSHHREQNR